MPTTLEGSIDVLVVEEILFQLNKRRPKPGGQREKKRKLLLVLLNRKEIQGTLDPLERILWAAFKYDEYADQVKYTRENFIRLKRAASEDFRKVLDALEEDPVTN